MRCMKSGTNNNKDLNVEKEYNQILKTTPEITRLAFSLNDRTYMKTLSEFGFTIATHILS